MSWTSGHDWSSLSIDALIDRLQGTQLRLNHPVDAGVALKFDRPWEGAFSGYVTVIKDGPTYRLYYRCLPVAGKDGNENEATCYAESADGVQWSKPELGIYELMGTRKNNAVLAHNAPFTHNFCPMLDARPGVAAAERFKALGGTKQSGLVAFVSADGLHWKKLREQAVITAGIFRFAERLLLVGSREAVRLLLSNLQDNRWQGCSLDHSNHIEGLSELERRRLI